MSGSQILQPEVSIALANAEGTVGLSPQQVLLVGQKTSAGSATAGLLVANISSSGAPENALFGEDSMLADMVRAFKALNQVVRVDAIPLDDDGGAVSRVLDFTLAGTATAAGSLTVTVGSDTRFSFTVAISIADDQDAVAAAIVAAINADLKVPFTASNVLGVVTLTAVNGGAVANDLGVEVILTGATGVTVSVPLAESTPGATDPTLTGVLDVALERYQGIVWPYSDVSALQTFLDAREDPQNAILDGVGFHVEQDTLTPLQAYGNAENDRSLVVFGDKQETETNYLGPAQNEASYVKATYFAAIRAIRLTPGQPISRFLTSSASLDQFGGSALASLPYFNTPISLLPTIKAGRGWTQIEIEQLFDAGVSVMGVNATGTTGLVGEVVTTYKTDAASNPDVTFKFLNYVDTTSAIREFYFVNYKARFAQSRLTEGAVTRGRDMVNEVVFRGFSEQLYLELAGVDFVLTQDGEDAIQFYKTNLDVDLDLSVGKITATMLVPIVTQFRQLIATIKVAFSTQ